MCCWTVVTWIIVGLLQLWSKYCKVDGAGDTYLGSSFLNNSIVLSFNVSHSGQSTWLRGKATTVQRSNVTKGEITSLTITISDKFYNYYCEIKHTDGVLQFPLTVFSVCAVADDDDLIAFMEGRKSAEVELNGRGNFTNRYLLMMINQTLHIHYVQGTYPQLRLEDVKCNVIIRDIDTNISAAKYSGIVEKSGSNDIGMIVRILLGCGAVIAVIGLCLVSWCVVTRRRAMQRGNRIEMHQHQNPNSTENSCDNLVKGVPHCDCNKLTSQLSGKYAVCRSLTV